MQQSRHNKLVRFREVSISEGYFSKKYKFVMPDLSSGMALGFFNLGPGSHMSDQIGVPSIYLFI